jgi:5-methyltetrahydrofolate--homocysteine methyltransferase
MSASSNAGRAALDTIELVVKEFGVNISIGASNISFGMPDRKYINATYIAMAIHAGLTCPITNPLLAEVNTDVLAADLSMGRDEYGMRWIKTYRKREKEKAAA